jgi:hypothetical protein
MTKAKIMLFDSRKQDRVALLTKVMLLWSRQQKWYCLIENKNNVPWFAKTEITLLDSGKQKLCSRIHEKAKIMWLDSRKQKQCCLIHENKNNVLDSRKQD